MFLFLKTGPIRLFHFAGGFSVAYAPAQIQWYFEKEKITASTNGAVFLPLIISLAATATVFWKFAEFGIAQGLSINIQIRRSTAPAGALHYAGGSNLHFRYSLPKSTPSSSYSGR